MKILLNALDERQPLLACSESGEWRFGDVVLRLPQVDGVYYLYRHAHFPLTESISVQNLYGARDGWSVMILGGILPGAMPLAIFARQGEEAALFMIHGCSLASGECTVVDEALRRQWSLSVFAHYFPEFALKPGALRAKQRLLKRISTGDALAELEKQVDLLSALVFALLDRPEAQSVQPEWYEPFRAAVAQQSSVAAKGEQASIADVDSQKSVLRALQQDYFALRAEYGDQCCDVCVNKPVEGSGDGAV